MIKEAGYILSMVVLVILLLQRECSHREDWRSWKSSLSTVEKSKTKLGEDVAKAQTIISEKKEAIKLLRYQNDSISAELSALIKDTRRPATATVVHSVTTVEKEVPVTVMQYDTVYIKDSVIVWPRYSASYNDRWIELMTITSVDSLKFRASFRNDLNLTHKRTRKGIVVTAVQKNPYTTTDNIKSFTVKARPKRLGIGIHLGYGITTQGRLTPTIGASIHYSLIQF